MKTRLLVAPLLFVLVASLAACGGGSGAVPANAVAVVGSVPITIADFNAAVAQAEAQIVAGGGTKPTAGTPQYTAMRNQVIAYLVQVSELEQQAQKEDFSVPPNEVTKFIANLAKTRFGGSMKKLTAELKAEGLTIDEARQQVYVNLLAQKIKDKVTETATASTAQARAYYTINIAQYTTPAQTTREVAHILVKKKSLADTIEQKLKNGANFAALAKQYSTDTASAQSGGKLCISKTGTAGSCIQTVPPFAKAGFALKNGQISQPVHSEFGWHIIKAVGSVKSKPADTMSFKDAQATIKQTLVQKQVDDLWSTWLSDLKKEYEGKVRYQASYAPPTTTALPTTTGIPTG